MKLLTKTTLYFLIALVPLLAASGFYLFSQFSRELNRRSDRELIVDELKWIQYLEREAANGTTFVLKTPDILVYPVDEPVTPYPSITDTYEFSAELKNRVPYRQLTHTVSIIGIPYQIILRKSLEQKAVLVTNVTRTMLIVFIGLFLATIIFNWIISERLWKPFRRSLTKIREAELQKMEAVHFEETKTLEFNELNASLNAMTKKIYTDYASMKEFTENAAHEMQTPLAVVQSKLELLLQDSNLQEEQVQSIVQAGSALDRLGKLNQGLLLLAKIDNNQFQTSEEVDLAGITRRYLELFQEITRDKQLVVDCDFRSPFNIRLHHFLADSLVTNLLGNAVKYNIPGGRVEIVVTRDSFMIANTSAQPVLQSGRLFRRFSPAGDESSNGLGLAIVKKIIDSSGLKIEYGFERGMHRFTVSRS